MNNPLKAQLQSTERTRGIVFLSLLCTLAALTFRTTLPSDISAQARNGATTKVHFSDYRVLFDRDGTGYPASSASFVYRDGKLSMIFQKASDGDSGLQASLTESPNLGKTWSQPVPFGPAVSDKKTAFQACHFSGVSAKGTLVLGGFFNPSGIQTSGEGINWRPNTALIGRQPRRDQNIEWTRYESGTFLGEQFVERGIVTRKGRIVLAIWGSARKGDNWQCGVLLSDDDGKTWRYRQVGYTSDLALRDRAAEPVGYNEQTLFEAHDGTLISMIRGRQKLAQLTDGRPRETYFSRSISKDVGETWSTPEVTNIAGTGATGVGLVLPDGSLLLAARIPHHVETTWIRPVDPKLYGLHLARSFDLGKTWQTEKLLQHDPEHTEFDNYYNTMNGQFIQLSANRWIYAFGQFDMRRKIHRMLALDLSWK